MNVILGHYFPISKNSKDYNVASIMNFVFGGSSALTSRIGRRLREDLGLVYSISSGFSSFSIPGAWSAKFGVDKHYVDIALEVFLEEVNRFIKHGITAQELDLAKSYLSGSYPLRFNSNAGMARALLVNEYYNLGDDYLNEYPFIINSISKNQVNEMIKKLLHIDKITVVKIGDI